MDGLKDVIEAKLLPAVSKIAPLLGSVLGSPLSGVAIALIAQAFNVHPGEVDKISQLLDSDPEAAIKLKTLEYDHAEMLAKIGSTDYATEVEDRKNAREYGAEHPDFLRHMAYLVTVAFCLATFLTFLPLNISSEEKNLLSILVGMLASKWQTIIDYFFGSSRHNPGSNNS